MAKLIEDSGAKDDDKIKMGLLANKFYQDNKPSFDKGKFSANNRKRVMGNFLIFMIQFETIVVKANRPLSGIGSASKEIMRLYSEMNKVEPSNLINIK